MSLANELQALIESGRHRIGEIEILSDHPAGSFLLCHWMDRDSARSTDFGGLELHRDPAAARDIAMLAADGSHRFGKAKADLKRGWALILPGALELRQALDLFYPAALGLFVAWRDGTLEIENLREKLDRQTGMYRFARHLSDSGAQKLIRETCGPDHHCARRILWRIDEATALDPSPASAFDGLPPGVPGSEAVPLLCREACNHFVNECRIAAKQEAKARQDSAS